MTNAQLAQANSHLIVTFWDDHVSNTTSNHFFCLSNEKKACLKQPQKVLSSEEMQNKLKEQCIKNKCLSDYIYYFE